MEMNRREFLAVPLAASLKAPTQTEGINGEPHGAKAGQAMFAMGGNVVDAIVSAACATAVATPNMCGFGGYGGHMILALEGGKKITCVDFNSEAPKAAHAAMYLINDETIPDRNMYGWMAAGVPGVPAGLDYAISRFGTFSFKKALQPAIQLCEEGFTVSAGLATAFKTAQPRMAKDPGSAALYYPEGKPLAAGSLLKNPSLGKMLALFEKENSARSFYEGEPSRVIAKAFKDGGGLVSEDDLKSYRANEAPPLRLGYGGLEIFTAPVTAGGVTILQALSILRGIPLDAVPPGFRLLLKVEAMRLAWRDRLALLGDNHEKKDPAALLLSSDYLNECRMKVVAAVEKGKCLPEERKTQTQKGTINLSAVDRHGNFAALTLTHGGAFGAQVTVPGLGLTLGHGMSRFEIIPKHPNAPGPRKRPLNNMCPTIVLRGGKAVAALGGRGGRRIPNSIFEVLFQLGLQGELTKAVAAPRIHTEGNLQVELEKGFGDAALKELQAAGLQPKTGPAATVSAVYRDLETGAVTMAMR